MIYAVFVAISISVVRLDAIFFLFGKITTFLFYFKHIFMFMWYDIRLLTCW